MGRFQATCFGPPHRGSDLDRVQRDFRITFGARSARRTHVETTLTSPLEGRCGSAETYPGRAPEAAPLLRGRPVARCAERGARRILGAIDADGRTHAVLYVASGRAHLARS
jgi:hypothetical protein